MPCHEEHCKHCEKFIGIRGDKVHTWMDAHTNVFGRAHRNSRHTPEDLYTCIKLFKGEYGEAIVRAIFFDHLILDGII